ncbi:hypothetical protein B0H14DRAFT_2916704, partial [Mycena olivaceomarginata]
RTLGAEFGSGFGGPGVSVPPPGALHRPTTSVAGTTTSLSYGYGASLLQRDGFDFHLDPLVSVGRGRVRPPPKAYRAMRSTSTTTTPRSSPSPARAARAARLSSGLGEVHVQPAFELSDSDAESDAEYDGRADTPTPARLAPYSNTNTDAGADSRAHTPLPASAQRFASPFQTMPLFVVPGPWEPAPAPTAASTGEWNEADMQAVIRALRGLRA